MWKIGVIGTGYWSEKHIKAWQFISDAEIKGFCDRNKGLLFEKAAQFHVPTEYCYTSLEEMLSEADIDVVDIITPPETHLELVRLVSAAENILCAKTFCTFCGGS
ncbi:Gfo/Idh/MocA family protein [Paenibacillus polymyxa]|uniref:Gfo/Idh/MocA family protein n=1 Tax=Paenibacillus polymyxa TaxID=1406 RepID=UPI0023782CE2|nr:Gfo/Idh/MocA family oxidoreductase [Paenibacillus polymyxa]WDM21117.1 Gfo/Idh/MocA family oxidoreductase [Paenibacillus polymyxa]